MSYASLLQGVLTPQEGFFVVRVQSLDGAADAFAADTYDLMILDLGLPDSTGMGTLDRMRADHPAVAILVMSGSLSVDTELEPLAHGAQEVFLKDHDDVEDLPRMIRRATARQDVLAEAAATAERERELRRRAESDLAWFDDLRSVKMSASELSLGIQSLSEALPDVMAKLTDVYEGLLDSAVRRVMYRDEPHTGPRVRAYATELAGLRAGPREVTEIHSSVLRRKIEDGTDVSNNLVQTEGRLLLVEVMGYLLSEYRTRALGETGTRRRRYQSRPPESTPS